MEAATVTDLKKSDIQGFVMSGHGRMPVALYLLLQVAGGPVPARRWLAGLADRLTTSEKPEAERSLHVAFTAGGLQAVGVDPADMTTFALPFREGMAADHRTNILGDTGPSSPEHWAWGGTGPQSEPVHAVLLLFATEDAFAGLEADERAHLADGGVEVIGELRPEVRNPIVGKFGTEHFGFADGMSQPVIRGSGQEEKLTGDDARRDVIVAGEFVLGYENGYGKCTPWPRLNVGVADGASFGQNGTYLVVRQLAQDVAGFYRYLDQQAGGDAAEADRLGAKMVGRWRSGAPLVKAGDHDDLDLGTDNSFGYAGLRCPIGAHIRRTNPRDSLRPPPEEALRLANLHRILRRGRVYGPGLESPLGGDDGVERGLFFLCLNANIERQFEFIQHTWANNSHFDGLYDEPDPLMATQPDGGANFTIPEEPVRRRLLGVPSFVTTRGGAYFFLPGISAVRQLASLTT